MAEPLAEDVSSPEQLDSSEFPPLPVRTKVETLVSSSSMSDTMPATTLRGQATKRPMRYEEDNILGDDSLTLSSGSASSESLALSSSSPLKKSRRLQYRDPPPILTSLDTDTFKNLFESPPLSDSQGSELREEIRLLQDFATSGNVTPSNSLGSLTDIIGCTKLDSFKGFANIAASSESAQTSPWIRSPASVHMESPGTPQDGPSFPIGISPASAPGNMLYPGEMTTPAQAECSRKENPISNQSFPAASNMVDCPLLKSLHEDMINTEASGHGSETQQIKHTEIITNATISKSTVVTGDPLATYLQLPDSEINVSTSANTGLTLTFAKSARVGNKMTADLQSTASVTSEPVSFEEQVGSPKHTEDENKGKSKCHRNKKTAKRSKDCTKVNSSGRKNSGQSPGNCLPEEESNEDDDDECNTSHGNPETMEGDFELKKCRKNPGHKAFHSPSELKVKHLPLEIQNEDSVTCLNCLSQLVVQITVCSTSSARGLDDEYSNHIGTSRKRNGSGFIASVDDEIRKYRCRAEDCPYGSLPDESNSSFEDSLNSSASSPTYSRNMSNMSTASTNSQTSKHYYYSGVRIHTNRHIVYDMSEAQNAYVKFFYNTPEGQGVIHGHVAAIVGINSLQDHVVLHVMSHDKALFNIINLHMKNAKSSYKEMVRSTDKMHQVHGHKYKHSWVAVISHPHGTSKTITIGRIQKEISDSQRIVKFYDAATCPGSSGGLVITPSLLKLQWPGAVHSGSDNQSGYNITFDSRVQDLDHKVMGKINKSLIHRKSSRDRYSQE